MLKIGDFSKLTRMSIRMLRHYDELNVLKPISVDDFTGYRYYSVEQLSLAGRITMLKNMGFSLTAIPEIIKQYGDATTLKQYLQIKCAEVKEQAQAAADRLLLLETTIIRLGKDYNTMKYDVNVKEIPQRSVASLREIISNYEAEGMLWGKLMQEIAPQNVGFANPCYSIAIFHDQGYKESEVDVEIQISVSRKFQDTKSVVYKTVAPIQVASVTFRGGYDQFGEINEAIGNWVFDNNYDFDGAMFNIYHVSPGMDKNPDNWVTEVCYPIKKK
ncbi:MAG: MerR family transcriptional regulator [Clostridiales bacterium GWF2_36_10]|nr:MAG: MerR family transcriptional regulator [Clostridiales bacterium GWF2_36_10]HAN21517.1 MerR family transcriptional regulator [Clostridiales bacterium]